MKFSSVLRYLFALVLIGGGLVTVLRHDAGWFDKVHDIETAKLRKMGEKGAARVSLPLENLQRGKLFENGTEIGIETRNVNVVLSEGRGRYSTRKGALVFSSSDGTDPVINGRVYRFATSFISPVLPGLLLFSLAVLLMIPEISGNRWFGRLWSRIVFPEPNPVVAPSPARSSDRPHGAHPSPEAENRDRSSASHPLSKGHFPELDGIRGWACLSVLIAHCITGLLKLENSPWIDGLNRSTIWLLLSGVDLFFVLSGFLIGGILIDQRGTRNYFKRFWIRRFARILPVAYVLLASYAIALYFHERWPVKVFDDWLLASPAPPLWSIATFTQNFFFAANGYGGPRWIGITWSLAIEEQFYMIFPVAVYLLSRRNLAVTVVAGIVMAPVLRFLFELSGWFPDWYGPYTLLPSRADGLFCGVAVAMIVRSPSLHSFCVRYRRIVDALGLAILMLILMRSKFDWWPSPIGSPFPPLKQTCLAIMWAIVILRVFTGGGLLNRIWRLRVLAKIGLISYGLYMYHQSVNGMMHGFIFGSVPTVSGWDDFLVSLAVIAISIGIATVSFVFLETPIRKFGHRISDRMSR